MKQYKELIFRMRVSLSIILLCVIGPNLWSQSTRVSDGILALFDFKEGAGSAVNDVSGVAPALNLTIADPPNVNWIQNGGLSVNSSTIISSPGAATKIIDAVKSSGEITIEAWIAPANTTQAGPARIVAITQDASNANAMLGQVGGELQVRFRTSSTNSNGKSPHAETINSNIVSSVLTHVLYTRSASDTTGRLYVNGGLVTENTSITGNTLNWDDTYRLTLANQLVHNRAWLGDFYLVAVYGRALNANEIAQNFAAGLPQGAATVYVEQDFTVATTGTLATVAPPVDELGGGWLEHAVHYPFGADGQGVRCGSAGSNRAALIQTNGREDVEVTVEMTINKGDLDTNWQGVSLRGDIVDSSGLIARFVGPATDPDLRLIDGTSSHLHTWDLSALLTTQPVSGDAVTLVLRCEGDVVTFHSIRVNAGAVETVANAYTLQGGAQINHGAGSAKDLYGLFSNERQSSSVERFASFKVTSIPTAPTNSPPVPATDQAPAAVGEDYALDITGSNIVLGTDPEGATLATGAISSVNIPGNTGTSGIAVAGEYGNLTVTDNGNGTFSYSYDLTEGLGTAANALSAAQTGIQDRFRIGVTDGTYTVTFDFVATINGANDAPVFDPTKEIVSLPPATEGQTDYSQPLDNGQFSDDDNGATRTWHLGGDNVSSWLSLASSTGVLSSVGAIPTQGSFNLSVWINDGFADSPPDAFTLSVNPAAGGGSQNVTDESITFSNPSTTVGSSINLSGADLVIENKEPAYIRARVYNTEAFVVDPNGNFGLGASSPSLNLHIAGHASSDILLDRTQNLNVDSTARLGVSYLSGLTDEYVFLGGGATLNNLAVQLDTGNVGIGTTTFAHKLNVAGTIRAHELIVDSTWADYVFEDGYELPTLEEVQIHIEEKGHLPGVPSAETIQVEGLTIGESQALLIQKIEELTLYMIEKERQFRELEKQYEAQQAEIEMLKSQIRNQ